MAEERNSDADPQRDVDRSEGAANDAPGELKDRISVMPIWVKNLGTLFLLAGVLLFGCLVVSAVGYALIWLCEINPGIAVLMVSLFFAGPLICKAVKSFFTEDWSKGWKGSKYKPED